MSWIKIGNELIERSSITNIFKYEKGGDYYISVTISYPMYIVVPNLTIEKYRFSNIENKDRRFKFSNKKVCNSYYRDILEIVRSNVTRMEIPLDEIILLDD